MTIQEYRELVDQSLLNAVQPCAASISGLKDAMNYSLMAGGKRIRPILVLEFSRISGGDYEKTLPVAMAIEMLHTYSLIHDDLPCMDNDDLRRGKPTNHVVYGECNAVLAGDALQAEAFRSILFSQLQPEAKCACAATLAQAAGLCGMCGGQFLDTAHENCSIELQELDEINEKKTGALLAAACLMGVQAAGGTSEQCKAAEIFGQKIGAAFQIRDDILDEISSEEELGKPIGSDKSNLKNTYMSILGKDKCEELVSKLTDEAKKAIAHVFSDTDLLFDLADQLVMRTN